ncbi:MAG: CHAT domain-containing protein [Candidatus Hermodarchaeota archaeon]
MKDLEELFCQTASLKFSRHTIVQLEESKFGVQVDFSEKLHLNDKELDSSYSWDTKIVKKEIKTPPEYRIAQPVVLEQRDTPSKERLVALAKQTWRDPSLTIERELEFFSISQQPYSVLGINCHFKISNPSEAKEKGVFAWKLDFKSPVSFSLHKSPLVLKKGLYDFEKGTELFKFRFKRPLKGSTISKTPFIDPGTEVLEIDIPKQTTDVLSLQISSTQVDRLIGTEIVLSPEFFLDFDLNPNEMVEFNVSLRIIVAPRERVASSVFLVAEDDDYWSSAVMAASLISSYHESLSQPFELRRLTSFLPILTFKQYTSLSDQVYQNLLAMPEVNQIFILGAPQESDLRSLLSLILERSYHLLRAGIHCFVSPSDAQKLSVVVRKVLTEMKQTQVAPELAELVDKLIQIHSAPLPELPLMLRRVAFQNLVSKHSRGETEVFLVTPENNLLQAALIPLARHFRAILTSKSADLHALKKFIPPNTQPLVFLVGDNQDWAGSKEEIVKNYSDAGFLVWSLPIDSKNASGSIPLLYSTIKMANRILEEIVQILQGNLSLDELEKLLKVEFGLEETFYHKIMGMIVNTLSSKSSFSFRDFLPFYQYFYPDRITNFIQCFYDYWTGESDFVQDLLVLSQTNDSKWILLLAANLAASHTSSLSFIESPKTKYDAIANIISSIESMIHIRDQNEVIDNLAKFGNSLHRLLISEDLANCLKTLKPESLMYISGTDLPIQLIQSDLGIWSLDFSIGKFIEPNTTNLGTLITLVNTLEETPRHTPLDILCVINPTLDLPGTESEMKLIQRDLEKIGYNFELIDKLKAKGTNVINAANQGIDILHFAGHGYLDPMLTARSGLLLTDKRLTGLEIRHMLNLWNHPTIFSNACLSSAISNDFVNAGAAVFIGPIFSIPDKPAAILAKEFYSALLDGWRVGTALRIAKNNAQQQISGFAWMAYQLIGNPQYIFSPLQEPSANKPVIYVNKILARKSGWYVFDQLVFKPIKEHLVTIFQLTSNLDQQYSKPLNTLTQTMQKELETLTRENYLTKIQEWEKAILSTLKPIDPNKLSKELNQAASLFLQLLNVYLKPLYGLRSN